MILNEKKERRPGMKRFIAISFFILSAPLWAPLLLVGGIGLVATRIAAWLIWPWPIAWGKTRCERCGRWGGCDCWEGE